ncbi:N-acetyl-gamma-glutamyl-phosphate reductase [Virgisporangium aurantiacum]|uniref:N-acetyl-gamma-glutamyl-phosphate reductase n=1 Tax=Virgisporangium aurantiacum TaxID=175570 RepID=A0A8J3Z658_9ACTN|nr:N-acetyl-gamma-glutamyl-phosphate reductase [Virgisporangium aurantiacum]GIJ58109.1 N-acetyl-gamma-glutamyl-phosphate reductase [Virgisporangium aurantiacum]
MGLTVSVAGASGYAGGELLRLIAGHPHLEVGAVTGQGSVGAAVGDVHPHLVQYAGRTFTATDPAALAEADLVFLALPHGESAAIASKLPAGVKVVDLGADFRLADPEKWAAYYSGPHAGTWPYGLPELPGQRAVIAAADRVAGPGCYATTITLALAPLIAAGVADPDDVVVVAASGTSGAGKGLKPHLLASEVMGGLTPYRVGAHQHVPEIKQATGARGLSFTPVLAPMPRGILATVTARPIGDARAAREALENAYGDEPFVYVLPEGRWPHTGATLGANTCLMQAGVDVDSGRIIVTSATDNLVKGAAGQALQCANLMLGLPETAGLAVNGVAP